MNNLISLWLTGSICLLTAYAAHESTTPREHLQQVLSNLKEIKSATYHTRIESWTPGDTVPTFVYYRYYRAIDDTADTTLGVKWVQAKSEDTTQVESVYDVNMHAYILEQEKEIRVDSFKVRELPFRPLSVPFYQYTRSIIEYALTTQDSTTLVYHDLGDSVYIKLTIYEDTQVEFFGKAHHLPEYSFMYLDPTSVYELWIDKATNLPYKCRREMAHSISVQTAYDATFNTLNIEDFVASSYFPTAYNIKQKGEGGKAAEPHELLGKKAPDWLLTNEHGEKVGLDEYDGKVLLIQFTSVNCGPCAASIPFLNKLSKAYDKNAFDLVTIESYTSNTAVLTSYRKRTGLDYPFLMSEKAVNKKYNVQLTPIHFILDKDRIIREVFVGYTTASEEEITQTIERLI